jgi:hypothetical protein
LLVTHRSSDTTLGSLLDVILDKGTTVDASAKVCFSGVDLLDTKSRITLSSFKTAKQIGLKFPENTNLDTQAWQVMTPKQSCPTCGRESTIEELKSECPWCGWSCKQNER